MPHAATAPFFLFLLKSFMSVRLVSAFLLLLSATCFTPGDFFFFPYKFFSVFFADLSGRCDLGVPLLAFSWPSYAIKASPVLSTKSYHRSSFFADIFSLMQHSFFIFFAF